MHTGIDNFDQKVGEPNYQYIVGPPNPKVGNCLPVPITVAPVTASTFSFARCKHATKNKIHRIYDEGQTKRLLEEVV